ncbi:MAG TPA: hypothetical protein VN736_19385 [Candidatus Limnocylindrales bacterium]|nr:hypothetical protein [Candidatus Limnocylindrales bacterium]
MRAALLLFVVAAVHAQSVFTPSAADLAAPASGLRCDIEPIAPRLNFSFRFQAGYTVSVPLSQFRGPGHSYTMLLAVTPRDSRRTVYLHGSLALPEVPKAGGGAHSAGSFLLGEGTYGAVLTVRDDSGRGCRREWPIEAHLKAGERAAKVPMPPGTVADISESGIAGSEDEADDGPRLTILLHAAPVRPRAAEIPPGNVELLLGAVSSLMHQARVSSAKLIAFNLDQQREIYRDENFRLRDLGKLSQSIYGLQLALIDYKAIQNSTPADLISSLVDGETASANPSSVVVFLGPRGRTNATLRKDALDPPLRHPPNFFYLEYEPWRRMAPPPVSDRMPGPSARGGGSGGRGAGSGDPAGGVSGGRSSGSGDPSGGSGGRGGGSGGRSRDLPAFERTGFEDRPDLLQQAVKALKGKTFEIHDAGQFARAIEQIRALAAKP